TAVTGSPNSVSHTVTVGCATDCKCLGITLNREYDELLLRLLAGEGGYLVLESEPAREAIRRELERRHRNTGIYREFAAAKVRLNPARIPVDLPDAKPAARATSEDGKRTRPAPEAARSPTRRVAATEKVRSGAGPKAAPDTCPACSRTLPDHDRLRFCPHCGENTREAPCPQCGEILQREWRFCIVCGARAHP
ncbi:MAG: zinc ribbon domain-containing protein, partial [Gammaproteobacteria bacterium]|nr:zinc ribbon domain-containing protein [Gammaproteobacteria bacterium]